MPKFVSFRLETGPNQFCSFLGLYFWDKPLAGFPFGFTSALCASLYMSAWQFDPCVKYRYRGDNELELYYGDLIVEHFQYSNGAKSRI